MKCPICNGTGKEDFILSCCGDDITGNDIDLCPTCKEHCGMEAEDCEECNGTGEVSNVRFFEGSLNEVINKLTDKWKQS